MDNLFAVYGDSSIFTIIKAETEEEALDIFVRNNLDDDILIEYIVSFAVNDGLLENFYRDEQGYLLNKNGFEYADRILALPEEEQERYIEFHIKKNAKKFWYNAPQFAEEFYRELTKNWESEDGYAPNFSEEFYVDTIKRIITNELWYKELKFIPIDLKERNYQLIFQEL